MSKFYYTRVNLNIFLALLAIVLFLTGCVFVRMMKIKSQLNDFESNFDLNDKNGLTLVFLNPELLADDILWIMKGSPVYALPGENGQIWEYVFQKQHTVSGGEGDSFDIPVKMLIVDDKLAEVTFPERFLENLSVPLLKKMLSSMGDADISKLRKTARSTFKGEGPDDIPNMDNVLETLGQPYGSESSAGFTELYYLYYLEDFDGTIDEENLTFELWFDVNDKDKSLKSVSGKIRGIRLSLDFTPEGG